MNCAQEKPVLGFLWPTAPGQHLHPVACGHLPVWTPGPYHSLTVYTFLREAGSDFSHLSSNPLPWTCSLRSHLTLALLTPALFTSSPSHLSPQICSPHTCSPQSYSSSALPPYICLLTSASSHLSLLHLWPQACTLRSAPLTPAPLDLPPQTSPLTSAPLGPDPFQILPTHLPSLSHLPP